MTGHPHYKLWKQIQSPTHSCKMCSLHQAHQAQLFHQLYPSQSCHYCAPYFLGIIHSNVVWINTALQGDQEDTMVHAVTQCVQLQVRPIAGGKILSILDNQHTKSKRSTSPMHSATHQALERRTQTYMGKECTCFIATVYK